ncbi:capsular polysaccharide biosynthesis protein [Sulfurimonas sp.]
MKYSFSKKLINNVENFFEIEYVNMLLKKRKFNSDDVIIGWGRKQSGMKAIEISKDNNIGFNLLEDGFIRSLGLGIDNSPSFSVVLDKKSIYYDATQSSDLEDILLTYDFDNDIPLMQKANEAISLIKEYHISKYNHAADISNDYFDNGDEKRVLVIAQTAGDASLEYGMANKFTTMQMITAAIEENKDAIVYVKIHPDVLSGKKSSDIDVNLIKDRCMIIDIDVNPISLIKYFQKVYTKTSQMGFEALLLGKECICFGMPFYAGWGVSDDRITCERRNRKLKIQEIFAGAYILYTNYYNPYKKEKSDIIDTIMTIQKYKKLNKQANKKVFCFGFSMWKHKYMQPYFKNVSNLNFINLLFSKNYLQQSLQKGLDENSVIYIWGKKEFPDIVKYANQNNIALFRVEDGFIRSVGLGSDLTQPYSLVFDSREIYFDPAQESDLEHMLNFHQFSSDEIRRAKKIKNYLIEKKLSKYNNYNAGDLNLPKDQKIILVPGQVENDASIKFGADGMSNLELLQKVRANVDDGYIIYKPHPDVLSGNRVGHVDEHLALRYCDEVVTEVSLDSVLSLSDEVHTITSLVGFEAIMRNLKVYTYGLPFYAGWGLSIDMRKCERRRKKLTSDELIAATLVLYPVYIDPLTKEFCEIEVTLAGLEQEKEKLASSLIYRSKINIRNLISRKLQQLFRFFNT